MRFFHFVVILFLFAGQALAQGTQTIERIVAIVNNEIITQSDLNSYAQKLRTGGLVDNLMIPDEATKQAVLKDNEKLLQKMIDERLLDSEVKRQNLQIPIERVEQEIRSIAKDNRMSREQLRETLKQKGVNFSEYQDFIKSGLERQSLMQKAVTSRIKISEQDVLNYYMQTNKNATDQVYEYTVSHALFIRERGGAEAAKQRAEQFLRRIRQGGTFEKLAQEFSEDPNFESGGLLGTFKSGEFKELDQAARALNVNDVTGVVETRAGFHVIKILNKKLVPDPRFEREKERIYQTLNEQAYKRQMQSWLEQLRAEAFIRINTK